MAKPAITELEDKLKEAERRIGEIKNERDEAQDLVNRMREQLEDYDALIDSWKEAFGMVLTDDGKYTWDPFIDRHNGLVDKYNALLRDWNRNVELFNSTIRKRPVGRPLDASDAQCDQVLALRKKGMSLRQIVEETNLGFQTVRTITERKRGVDRTTMRHLERIDPDRKAVIEWKSRKRTRDALPRRINATLEQGQALVKEAKGQG
jgi:Helix-turn-helix domain of resolvase